MEEIKNNNADEITNLIITTIEKPVNEIKQEIKNLAIAIENKKTVQVRTIQKGRIVIVQKLI